MSHNFQLWPSRIPPEKCEDIIEKCREVASQKGGIAGREDDKVRNSTVRWVSKHPEMRQLVGYFFQEANRRLFNVDMQHVFDIQFTEYHAEGNQHYSWHEDIHWDRRNAYDRKLSLVLQLSDPDTYEGGELEFLQFRRPDEFRERGSIIVFPSYVRHRVTPVTEGTRYSLVSWIEGPRWR